MLKSPFLFLASLSVALFGWTNTAKAENDTIGLSFDLPPTKAEVSAPVQPAQLIKPQEPLPPLSADYQITAQTTAPTIKDIGVQFIESSIQLSSEAVVSEPVPSQPTSSTGETNPLQALSFGADLLESYSRRAEETSESTATASLAAEVDYSSLGLDDWIFEGGPRSLVAHTVGSAEGTRRWDGEKTQAYYGHTDPGNGVWNLGTFSYQHKAKTPEEADKKQIRRLKSQGFQLEEQAARQGRKLSLIEKLNGLDLANQAPLAALGEGGYIERLAQADRMGMKGEEAIAWARTRAYIDPDTKSWNAPGLGNNLYSISKDQERRMYAIDKALRAYDKNDRDRVAFGSPDVLADSPAADIAESVTEKIEDTKTTPSLSELLPEQASEDAPTLIDLLPEPADKLSWLRTEDSVINRE